MSTPALAQRFSALREQHRLAVAQAVQAVAQGRTGARVGRVLKHLAAITDDTLRSLWAACEMPSALALLGVGGYGRGQLFPHSDVDVLLLLPDPAAGQSAEDVANTHQASVERFITACWDSGLEIGSSVRSVADCVAESQRDVTVQTSMLEARLIVGAATAFRRFRKAYAKALDPQAFLVAKTLEMRQRHTKFENTPYSLEPNCKESPGGLRDLQVILWVARAARLGQSWDELAKSGIATAHEVRQIKRNEATLSSIRLRLHLLARRREDRLVFDLQTAVAESFGDVALMTPEGRLKTRASEALMKRYYWAAKAVAQLNQILLLNIQERLNPNTHELRPLNERFFEKAGMIEVASDDLYQREPHAILETFLIYQRNMGIKGLSARTLRALYAARGVMDARFRADPVNRGQFLQILQQPSGITHALRLMNQTSVLGRTLWVFRRIVGQMQHDLFHVYTVDQHILMVVRNVRRFFMVEHSHEYPFCSQLAAGWDKPWILYTAALFHDIAKGRGGDHSDLGVAEVRRFGRAHGLADHRSGREDLALIEFLVREHLSMSRIAQKEDLSDADVVRAFAKRVGTERRLTALYLLTVADIRGTSPKVWNNWKGKLLDDLYRATLRMLGGRAPDRDAEIEARKREALVELAFNSQPHEAHKLLWDTLDVRYFMRHDASDIAWHTRQLSRHLYQAMQAQPPQPVGTLVRARQSPVGDGLEVMVYTPDQPDLFARICGYFDQGGYSIIDAKVHTANNGYALDTFVVVTQALPEHYRELTVMVEQELARVLQTGGALPQPSQGRVSRRVKSFPIAPRVDLQPDERAQRWLLTISASDRAGLLYRIARVLARHRINLELAKISTLGERVEDTFLIDGAELQQSRRQIEIETELLAELAS